MSEPSFARDRVAAALLAAISALAVAACGGRGKPEADPKRLETLMRTMDRNAPGPGGASVCKPEEMVGGATMTQPTLLKIGHDTANPGPEREEWINPPELDSPAARELADPSLDETARRQAAYELLSAPFFLVYRIDLVDAPMALGVKDLKRGVVGARAIRYDRSGNVTCVKVMIIPNSLAKSDWAILKSNLPVIDPKVAEALRLDLREQLLQQVAALGRPDDSAR